VGSSQRWGVAGAVGVAVFLLSADEALPPFGQEDHLGPLGKEGFYLGQEGLEAKPVGKEELGLGEGLGQGGGGLKGMGVRSRRDHRGHLNPIPAHRSHQVGQDGRGGRHSHLGQGGDQKEQKAGQALHEANDIAFSYSVKGWGCLRTV
jgi:hypothetical protein